MDFNGAIIGFAMCGSYCTFDAALEAMQALQDIYGSTLPILSENAAGKDTRFGTAEFFRNKMREISGKNPICTIEGAEPIGPKKMCSILVVAPCTGNTLSKLANGITDTSVTMACKSHLRNGGSVLLAVSTNDGLSGSAESIGKLLNRRNYYFVPFGQDDPAGKPKSLRADFRLLPEAVQSTLEGGQIQPILKEFH